MAGESEAVIKSLEIGMRLSPREPSVFWTHHSLALAHFAAERYDEAIKWSRQALSSNPEFAFAHRTLATSLAYGRTTYDIPASTKSSALLKQNA